MTTFLKENPPVLKETENPLLATFEHAMDTIWNCPEVQPIPKSSHTRQIFDRLHRMCLNGIPEPDISPDEEGLLHVAWKEGDQVFYLHIDVLTLRTLVSSGDLGTMKIDGCERWLRGETDWKAVEGEFCHALRYQSA